MTETQDRKIVIFDTTLRDGEQSPGASMNLAEKMEVAQALVDLGVDVIEAGFPIASPGDFEAVREIAKTVRGSVICGLARCREADIDRAWEAVKHAEQPRIHVFLATSAIHRELKLKMDKEEIIQHAVEGVKRAAGYCSDVEFSPEDAVPHRDRLPLPTWSRRPSTPAPPRSTSPTPSATPRPTHMGDVIRTLRKRVPNIDKAVISVHCHNDLGLAVANSLAAVEAGAGQVECTINGIGERAGNCSLEEIVMALRHPARLLPRRTPASSPSGSCPPAGWWRASPASHVQRNKAIVGQNAFAHEAGIHQDGMLKERTDLRDHAARGRRAVAKTDLVLGKHSGRAALADRGQGPGLPPRPASSSTRVFEEFKLLADKKKEIYDADIAALVEQEIHAARRAAGRSSRTT